MWLYKEAYCLTKTLEMKIKLLIFFCLSSEIVSAMTQEDLNTVKMVKGIYAIAMVESGLNPEIVNKYEDAVGILQIRPIMVKEANRILGFDKFKLKDRFSAQVSIEIFLTVQRHHNKDFNLKTACWIWNGGTIDTTKNKCNRYYTKVLLKLKNMETMNLLGTSKSPELVLNPNGELKLSGRSIPEDAKGFYMPALEWAREYAINPAEETKMEVRLEYFNTSSSKCILDIFKILEGMFKAGRNVEIVWFYEEDDEDMLEAGEDYASIIRVPFKLCQLV
jgi:hypothetical protein